MFRSATEHTVRIPPALRKPKFAVGFTARAFELDASCMEEHQRNPGEEVLLGLE
jgi:hypothetical protein